MFLDPFSADTRFSKAAAGLKNMCANFDHGTDPKRTVVATTCKPKNTFAHELPVICRHAQIKPNVTLARSERMNRSARIMRNGELPSAATSARMKNQNQ